MFDAVFAWVRRLRKSSQISTFVAFRGQEHEEAASAGRRDPEAAKHPRHPKGPQTLENPTNVFVSPTGSGSCGHLGDIIAEIP